MKRNQFFGFFILIFLLTISSHSGFAKKDDKPAEKQVAAKVGDREIAQAELDEASKQDLLPLASQIYQIQKSRLDQMIQDALYAQEAKAQKKSVDEIKKQANAAPSPVSDDAIETYFDLNQAKYQGKQLADVKEEIRQALVSQRAAKSQNQALADLKKKYPIQIFLEEPKIEIDISGHPARGAQNGKVTIVEFSDFQCPFCKKFTSTIDQVVKDYPNDVKHVFRNLPLQFHNQARGAARAGVCADKQGKFWQYREVLFNNNTAMDETNLKKYAEQVGLDAAKFDACMKDPATDKLLDDDLAYAQKVGARGTPTSFVNGVLFSGARPYEELKRIIDQKLGK